MSGKLVIEFKAEKGHENKMFKDEREKDRGRVREREKGKEILREGEREREGRREGDSQ